MPQRKNKGRAKSHKRVDDTLEAEKAPVYSWQIDHPDNKGGEAVDGQRDDAPPAFHDASSDASEAPAKTPDRRWQWSWTNLLRLRTQITLSVLAGVAVAEISYFVHPLTFSRAGDLGAYLTLLLGIASVLALVGSVTFGFLTYYAQAIQAEKTTLYASFRAAVKELREFLDELHDEGTIDERYDFHFGLIDEITLTDFPLMTWGERVDPLIQAIEDQRDDLEESEQFGRVIRGLAYRTNVIEETIRGLFKNFIAHILVERMTEPVLKALGTLVAVMLIVLLTPLAFDLVPRAASWSIATSLAFMTCVMLVEMAMVVRREMKEFDVTAAESEANA